MKPGAGALTPALLLCLAAPPALPIEVAEVEPGLAADVAGIRSGDRITAWSIPTLADSIESLEHPLDLLALERRDARAGRVSLHFEQNGSTRRFELPIGPMGIEVLPVPHPVVSETRRRVATHLADGETGRAIEAWTSALPQETSRDRCWGQLRLVGMLVETRAAEQALDVSRKLTASCPTDDAVFALDSAAHRLRELRLDTEGITALWDEALRRLGRSGASGPVLESTLRHNRGTFLARRGNIREGKAEIERAAELMREAAPASWGRADSLGNLGIIHIIQGRLDRAEAVIRNAMSIVEADGGDSLLVAGLHADLAIVLRRQGRLSEARNNQERALAIRRRLAPSSGLVAMSLNNLGVLAKNQGDLRSAENYYREALAIRRAVKAGPLDMASVLGNLANLALERHDPEESLRRHRQVLDLLESVAPEHRMVVTTLHALGMGELLRGRHGAARKWLEQALELQEGISRESSMYAAILEALGALEAADDRIPQAREWLQRSLQIRERGDPGSLDAASVLLRLAQLDESAGLHRHAMAHYRRAARMAAERSRGSLAEARARFGLANLLWQAGKHDESLAAHEAALDAFEHQRERLGGDWLQRMRFGAEFSDLYLHTIERLVALDSFERALQIESRYRAYERRRLRSQAPDIAADNAPKTPAELADLLPDETVMVSYIVTENASLAFVLGQDAEDPLAVRSLEQPASGWGDALASYRLLSGLTDPSEAQLEALERLSGDLHRRLITPIADRLESADRLVILPDGELHQLPFAALLDPATDRYLIERWTLRYATTAPDALAGSQVLDSGKGGFLTIADPTSTDTPDQRVLRADRRDRLAAAERETTAISQLFPGRVEVLSGDDASESNVRSRAGEARVLHFATHAVVDGARPLDAYIPLAGGDRGSDDDGQLTAWEVMTHLDLDADLVTLAACRTALGQTLGGEGVLGLTHAFQVAGARSVVASLWDVPDEPTARLMESFYEKLESGLPVDVALQRAQVLAIERQRGIENAGWLTRRWRSLRGLPNRPGGPVEWAAFRVEGLASANTD